MFGVSLLKLPVLTINHKILKFNVMKNNYTYAIYISPCHWCTTALPLNC